MTAETESLRSESRVRSVIAAGRRHSVGVNAGGAVVTAGVPQAPECHVGAWRDIVAVAAGNVHTASNTGRSHTVGLCADGTVVAVGWTGDGQREVAGWTGVMGIAAGWRRTLAVLADGTVRATGRPNEGACAVDTWSEIVSAAAGDWQSVGLRADGTATAAGNNRRGQCQVFGWRGLHSIRSRRVICTPWASPMTDVCSLRATQAPASTRAATGTVWLRCPRAVATRSAWTPGAGSSPLATTALVSATSRLGMMFWLSRPAPHTPLGFVPMDVSSPPGTTTTASATRSGGTSASADANPGKPPAPVVNS